MSMKSEIVRAVLGVHTVQRVLEQLVKAIGRIVLVTAFVAGIAGGCMYLWIKVMYPYGVRTEYLSYTVHALDRWADDHSGWYPRDGVNPLECLRQLYPAYLPIPEYLAGVSGSPSAVKQRLDNGGPLDASVSSWVYHPGLRSDDPWDLALMWEARSGIGGNGVRVPKGAHAVAFISTECKLIAADDWPTFVQQQARYREEVIRKRRKRVGTF